MTSTKYQSLVQKKSKLLKRKEYLKDSIMRQQFELDQIDETVASLDKKIAKEAERPLEVSEHAIIQHLRKNYPEGMLQNIIDDILPPTRQDHIKALGEGKHVVVDPDGRKRVLVIVGNTIVTTYTYTL